MKPIKLNGKYYQEYNVVMLPSENKSDLILKIYNNDSNKLELNTKNPEYGLKFLGWKYHHLYIISDGEEIKEGDICFNRTFGDYVFHQVTKEDLSNKLLIAHLEKIIASSDQSLFLHLTEDAICGYISLIPINFINQFIERWNSRNENDNVLVEMEEEAFAKCLEPNGVCMCNGDNDKCEKDYRYKLKLNLDNTINIVFKEEKPIHQQIIDAAGGEEVFCKLAGITKNGITKCFTLYI